MSDPGEVLRARLPDPRTTRLCLDANVFQSAGAQGEAAGRLLDLNREGEVDCILSQRVAAELMDPRTPPEVRVRAQAVRVAPASAADPAEPPLLERVAEVLQGQAAPGRHAEDAANLADAYRHASVFITNDRRLLRRREALAAVMPSLRITSPAEVMDAYDAWLAADEDWRNQL